MNFPAEQARHKFSASLILPGPLLAVQMALSGAIKADKNRPFNVAPKTFL